MRRKPSAICKFVTRKFPRVWIQVEVFASLQQCKDFIPFTIVENNEVWKTKAIRQYVLVCELLARASHVPAFQVRQPLETLWFKIKIQHGESFTVMLHLSFSPACEFEQEGNVSKKHMQVARVAV